MTWSLSGAPSFCSCKSSNLQGLVPLQRLGSRSPSLLSKAAEPANQATPFDGVVRGPQIGFGSYGRVFAGQTQDGTRVALKVIKHSEVAESCDADMTEASIGVAMDHPNVLCTMEYVRIPAQSILRPASPPLGYRWAPSLEHGPMLRSQQEQSDEEDETVAFPVAKRQRLADVQPVCADRAAETWVMMEYANRGTLRKAIDECTFAGKLEAVLDVSCQLAQGMAYLHEQGVLHGDLSPNNVLLTQAPAEDFPSGLCVKVCDFGLARVLPPGQASICTDNAAFGTPHYTAPEHLMDGIMGKESDVYSFGIILVELLTGQRVFASCSSMQVMARKMQGSSCDIILPETVPEALVDLATRCMSDQRQERPSFGQALAELRDMQQQLL